jgi:hypothetical protein
MKKPMQKPMQPQEAEVEQVKDELVNEDVAKLGPAQEAQLENYTDNATIAVYSEKSQPTILQLLQSEQSPVASVANTAFQVHKQLEAGLVKTGERMTEITLCLGAAHLVSELVVLAQAAKLYTLNPEERLEAFRQAAQRYFEEGFRIFKEQGANAMGAIDPVKFQQTIEPLLTENQRNVGMQMARENGISQTAPASGMMAMDVAQQQQPPQQQQPQGFLGGAANGV